MMLAVNAILSNAMNVKIAAVKVATVEMHAARLINNATTTKKMVMI